MPVRWGIMGTATIADSVQQAMADAPSAEPVAIASRTVEKARAWADERGMPKAYGSYAELLTDDEIDAVYIPLPTTMHIEWVVKAAEAGKHILVEKPVGTNEAEVATMTAACAKAGFKPKYTCKKGDCGSCVVSVGGTRMKPVRRRGTARAASGP